MGSKSMYTYPAPDFQIFLNEFIMKSTLIIVTTESTSLYVCRGSMPQLPTLNLPQDISYQGKTHRVLLHAPLSVSFSSFSATSHILSHIEKRATDRDYLLS